LVAVCCPVLHFYAAPHDLDSRYSCCYRDLFYLRFWLHSSCCRTFPRCTHSYTGCVGGIHITHGGGVVVLLILRLHLHFAFRKDVACYAVCGYAVHVLGRLLFPTTFWVHFFGLTLLCLTVYARFTAAPAPPPGLLRLFSLCPVIRSLRGLFTAATATLRLRIPLRLVGLYISFVLIPHIWPHTYHYFVPHMPC